MNAPLTVPDLLDSAARLAYPEFESFFKAMLDMRARRLVSVLPAEESVLLEKIYQKLPENILTRYEILSEQRQNGSISNEAYQELLRLIPVVEQYNVERLKCMVALAELRKITVQELMEELSLIPIGLNYAT